MSNETVKEIKTKKSFRPPRWMRRAKAKLSFLSLDWKTQAKALTHFLVVALAFVALNWILAPNDPGWLKVNPSPWVLLPLYMGFQFGFIWGIASGLLQVGTRFMIANMTETEVMFGGDEQFLLWSMVLTGAMGGFVRGVQKRQDEKKNIALRDSLQSSELLKSQVALLKHNEHELSNAMVSQGMEESSLTLSLRDVVLRNEGAADRDEAFLSLIGERCGANAAAIYYSANGGKAIRTTYTQENTGVFPESMQKTPMIKHAERTGEIVTQRWFWEPFEPSSSESIDDQFLAVMAHPVGLLDYRILIISQMAFENIHWENLWKLEASFRWYEDTTQTGKIDPSPVEWQKSGLNIAEPEPAPEQPIVEAVEQPSETIPPNPIAAAMTAVDPIVEEAIPPVEPIVEALPPVNPIAEAIPPAEPIAEPIIEQIIEPVPEVDPIVELEKEVEPLYNPTHHVESPMIEPIIEDQEIPEPLSIEPFASTTLAVVGRPILGPTEFKHRLAECRQAEATSQTVYRLVIFVPNAEESPERCEQFAQSLSEAIAPTDDLSRIPSEGGNYVYGLITAATTAEAAEQYAGVLLTRVYDLELRFFVLNLDDPALSAFTN